MKKTLQLGLGQKWTSFVAAPDQAAGVVREIITLSEGNVGFRVEGSPAALTQVSEVAYRAWIRETEAVLTKDSIPYAQLSPGLELGRRIRLLREMAGLSQQQLAEKVGISRSAVAFWETGRSGHVGKHLGGLAAVLGVEPEVLLTGMAYKAIQATLTPDESTMVTLYRQLDPLIKLQAQKWIERRVRHKESEGQNAKPPRPPKPV
ncbi:helix-turn-helix transcriptional regulator [Gluconobacter cerevisiae]|uniref:Helix-turn-helix transcriptional regulator n=1 Tax=Gluconobacter cerevisiae TaxID=1379734 RepID=A0ABR9YBJ4_9PROT|nr:helix-turn-helix transcriptional regulator [Gluconobacter cerevisiae]MBF0876015.1 helix-turn-helix transcriptional regulator [Gluconobacter cerevisiae]